MKTLKFLVAGLVALVIVCPVWASADVIEDTPEAIYARAAQQAPQKRTVDNPRIDGNNSFRRDPQVTATNFVRTVGAAVSAGVEIFEAP